MLLVELLMVFLSIFPFAPGSCCCLLHSTNIRCDFHQQSFFLHALQRVLFSLVSSSYFVFSFNKAALIYLALLYPTRHSALRISEEEYTAVPFPTVVMLVIVGMVCVARQLSREGEHGTGFELSCLSLRSTFLFGQSIVGFASYCKADHSRTKAFSFFVSSHANASTAVAFTA